MAKRKVVAYIVLICTLILYIFQSGSYTLFLPLVVGIYLISSKIISQLSGRKIQISIDAERECQKNEIAKVGINLKNHSNLPVFRGRVTIKAKNIITGEMDISSLLFSLGPKRESRIDFQIKDEYCGCLQIVVEEIAIYGPLEIFMRKEKIYYEKEISILPRVFDLPILKEDLYKYDMESYKYSSLKKGNDPSETFGVREYLQGDSMKTIHWKLSGKMDEIMVRELGLPIENKLLIILDKRLIDMEYKSPKAKEEAVELFISLSNTIVRQGITHSIGWYSYEEGEFKMEKIQNEDDLWIAATFILKASYEEDEASTIVRFLESNAPKRFSNYIYVTDGEDDIERLMEYGEVNTYRPENFK